MPRDSYSENLSNQDRAQPDREGVSTRISVRPAGAVAGEEDGQNLPLGVGEACRQKRLALGLDLEECHQRTRIRQVLLQALEDENLSQLPSNRTTVRAYVRAYAKCLGLDGEQLVMQFNDFHYPHTEAKVSRSPKPLPTLPTNTILFLAIALLVVILLIGMMQSFLNQPDESLEVKISPLPMDQQRKVQLASPPTEPIADQPLLVIENADSPVVSVTQPTTPDTQAVLQALRISHTKPLLVNVRRKEYERTITEMHLLEPAEALNLPLEQGASLHIPQSDSVMLMLIGQNQRVVTEVPYQAIADNQGWVHFETLLQE